MVGWLIGYPGAQQTINKLSGIHASQSLALATPAFSIEFEGLLVEQIHFHLPVLPYATC
jgi:hypothetical protein